MTLIERAEECLADGDCTCSPAKGLIRELLFALAESKKETARECADMVESHEIGSSTGQRAKYHPIADAIRKKCNL